MPLNKYIKNIYPLIVAIILGSTLFSCKPKMICAAYTSSFFVKEDLAYNHFFVLGDDSMPKVGEKLHKNSNGIYGNDGRYGKKTKTKKLNIIAMKMVKSKDEEGMESDSTGSVFDETATADASDSTGTSESKYNSYNWNSDMQLYYYYIGQHIEEVSTEIDSSALELENDTTEKLGFFARLFGGKKKKDELEADTTTEVDPYAEFDFSTFEDGNEEDEDSKGKRKKGKKKKKKKKKEKKKKNKDPQKKEDDEDINFGGFEDLEEE